MADCVVMPNSCSEQLCHNQDVHIVRKCFNCVDLESQLKETHHHHHHHHVPEGLGLIPVPCILKMKLVPLSLPQSSYVSSSFGLYCSACFGILFVSILCMCCSHFSWYCFISFTIFSAPIFSLIHWFFFFI